MAEFVRTPSFGNFRRRRRIAQGCLAQKAQVAGGTRQTRSFPPRDLCGLVEGYTSPLFPRAGEIYPSARQRRKEIRGIPPSAKTARKSRVVVIFAKNSVCWLAYFKRA